MVKKALKKVVIILSLGAALCGILVFAFSYTVVKKFIYRRIHAKEWLVQNAYYNDLLRQQYDGKPVSFFAADGSQLAGLLFVRPQAKRVILLCHGYSRTKERLYHLITLFPNDTILIFDYRAHGESVGDFTTIGYYEKDDVLAAYNFLSSQEQTKNLPIFGIGISMGAVSLLGAAAAGANFKGIVVDSAFKKLDEQIATVFSRKTGLPLVPFMSVCQSIFEYLCNCAMHDVDSVKWAQQNKVPIFIVHSNTDAFTNVAAAHAIYASVPGYKKLWIVDDAIHGKIFKKYPEDYVREVSAFFNAIENGLEH